MYIFVGLLYSDARRKQIINQVKTSLESAANTYQWGLLGGLQNNTQERITIVNSVPMGTFPRQSNILCEKSFIEKENNFEIDNIGYCNLPIIKQHQRAKGLYKRLCKILKEEQEQVTIILYSLYHPYLKALDRLKRKYSHFQYIVIVPDLPCEYGIESSNKVKRWLNRRVGYKALSLAKKADGFIFLTEYMHAVLDMKECPYEIIEGIGYLNEDSSETPISERPVILYTGNLDRVFGIGSLVEAYLQLPEGTAELWIAGGGNMQDEIQTLSRQNQGVKFLGYCTKEEVHTMQAKAWVLVNPRSGQDEYAKYSFPSKTMEYLSSGRPVAMNRLPGIPQEYEKYIFFFEEESPVSMAKTFQEIFNLSLEELEERKRRQLDFIRNQKSGKAQASKIIKLKETYFNKD